MQQYLLSVLQPDGPPPAPHALDKIMRDVEDFHRELKAAGAWVFAGGLNAPGAAKLARLRDGRVLVTDGPFAETKEHLGGLTIIQAPDLDSALEWARKAARATTLPIELRLFQRVFG